MSDLQTAYLAMQRGEEVSHWCWRQGVWRKTRLHGRKIEYCDNGEVVALSIDDRWKVRKA
jgi:hypothetical protein